jgi:hypothetical protein
MTLGDVAYGSKADIIGEPRHVGNVPTADAAR